VKREARFSHVTTNHTNQVKTTLSNFVIRTERVGEPILPIPCDAPERIYAYHGEHIAPTMQDGKEHLHVLLLDSRLRVIGFHLVSMGSLTEATAHPREILRPVILAGAYGFAMTHNHPSGDPSPSHQDEMMTRRMVEAADLLSLRLLDHVIIGEPAGGRSPYYSFREAGIIV